MNVDPQADGILDEAMLAFASLVVGHHQIMPQGAG